PGPDAREQGGQPAAGDRRRFGVLMSSLFSDWMARQSAAPEAHAPAPEAQADVAAEAPAPDARPAEAEAAPVGADASGAVTAEPVAESGAGTAGPRARQVRRRPRAPAGPSRRRSSSTPSWLRRSTS